MAVGKLLLSKIKRIFSLIINIVTNQWVKKLTLLTVFCRNEQGDFREIFELFKI